MSNVFFKSTAKVVLTEREQESVRATVGHYGALLDKVDRVYCLPTDTTEERQHKYAEENSLAKELQGAMRRELCEFDAAGVLQSMQLSLLYSICGAASEVALDEERQGDAVIYQFFNFEDALAVALALSDCFATSGDRARAAAFLFSWGADRNYPGSSDGGAIFATATSVEHMSGYEWCRTRAASLGLELKAEDATCS